MRKLAILTALIATSATAEGIPDMTISFPCFWKGDAINRGLITEEEANNLIEDVDSDIIIIYKILPNTPYGFVPNENISGKAFCFIDDEVWSRGFN